MRNACVLLISSGKWKWGFRNFLLEQNSISKWELSYIMIFKKIIENTEMSTVILVTGSVGKTFEASFL